MALPCRSCSQPLQLQWQPLPFTAPARRQDTKQICALRRVGISGRSQSALPGSAAGTTCTSLQVWCCTPVAASQATSKGSHLPPALQAQVLRSRHVQLTKPLLCRKRLIPFLAALTLSSSSRSLIGTLSSANAQVCAFTCPCLMHPPVQKSCMIHHPLVCASSYTKVTRLRK